MVVGGALIGSCHAGVRNRWWKAAWLRGVYRQINVTHQAHPALPASAVDVARYRGLHTSCEICCAPPCIQMPHSYHSVLSGFLMGELDLSETQMAM